MRRNLFTIAPGAPFLRTFVDAFLAGEIVGSITREASPLELARATIYVPTQRAARALVAEFAQAFEGRATLLPRILPLGGLEESENAALFSESVDALDDALAPPIDELERRLLLARLIQDWARAIGRAIVSVDADGVPMLEESEPLLIAASPANAFALAADLGALIDEFAIENIAMEAIRSVSEEAFDKYWSITTKFLSIALEQWPAILAERGRIDAADRQRLLVEMQIEALAGRTGEAPVITLGSTGAHPTTARLLSAIVTLDNGAVVLPGLDQKISETAWARIGANSTRDEPAFTHPQTVLKRLLGVMGAERGEARELARLTPAADSRRGLIAQAMLPADETALWRDYRAAKEQDFAQALDGVAILEAPDERLEALALALFMREALETPGQTAALVTPDRNVARRVAAELQRFSIDIDDSGGKPLAMTSIGSLARLVASMGAEQPRAVTVAALLGHPLVALGLDRACVVELAPLVEIGVLRVIGPGENGYAGQVPSARLLSESPHAHIAARRITGDQWRDIETMLARIDAAFKPWGALGKESTLATMARAHRVALEAVIVGGDAGEEEGAATLFELLARLEKAEGPSEFDAASYVSLFDSVAFEMILRGPRRAHPRLKILGPLEARLIEADLILLAGLDEGVWPPQTETGAFLNRSMRAQLGLPPPERRIGQSAHDFMMALGARRVVLSRALKREGSPTVASRFLTRLVALAGDAVAPSRAEGARMLAIAEALDQAPESAALTRPTPRPPLALRPQKLSVTRIERLRRDPYAIYAEYVLKLTPLAALGEEPGLREIGTALHEALAKFVEIYPRGALPEESRETLLTLARKNLAGFLADPAFLNFQWPGIEAGLEYALAFEKERRLADSRIYVETKGVQALRLEDGSVFTLTAVADRIEVDQGGFAHIFDYKTGNPPSWPQVVAGFSPQLTLEAAMVEAGAFVDVGVHPVESAAYIALGQGKTRWIGSDKTPFRDIVAKHREELKKLLEQFRKESTPYPSRPHVTKLSDIGDYDHLARVKEWSRGGEDA